MTRVIKKKTLFLLSLLFTGVVSMLGHYLKTNYSKSDSLIVPTAKADTPTCGSCGCPWTEDQCTVYWCFPAGTIISTPSGSREIEKLKEGDLVYGFNTETGEKGEYPITRTFKHAKDDPDGVASPLIKISHAEGVFISTDNHWVYRRNGREGQYANFDRAGMLQVGDMLTLEDGREVAITAIEKGADYDFVYNLEVKDVHTYFAHGVRVHNSDGSGDGGCCGSSSTK